MIAGGVGVTTTLVILKLSIAFAPSLLGFELSSANKRKRAVLAFQGVAETSTKISIACTTFVVNEFPKSPNAIQEPAPPHTFTLVVLVAVIIKIGRASC